MLKLFLTALIITFFSDHSSSNSASNSQPAPCPIEDILEAQLLPTNSYALTGFGSFEPATKVLIPVKYDSGIYSEFVTRKGDNLYKVDGVNLYIKTSMCYEYTYSKEAIIEIRPYGGELIFK